MTLICTASLVLGGFSLKAGATNRALADQQIIQIV
jgi:hypothetical protein